MALFKAINDSGSGKFVSSKTARAKPAATVQAEINRFGDTIRIGIACLSDSTGAMR